MNKNLKQKLVYALVILASIGVTFGAYKYVTAPIQTEQLGAGYNPVTGYQSRTTSFVNSTASVIPVASTQDPAGNQIVLSNISSSSTVKVYFNLEPGTAREESIYCTGVTANSWTGCVRGIPFQGSSDAPSTTLQMAHNAGAAIIMTNISQFYNNFVATDGDQLIYGSKMFGVFPSVTSTTGIPTTANQLATKFYVDSIGAGGFTANNVSSTLGLQVITSGVPNCPSAAACVGVSASSTGAINFYPGTGTLYVGVSSTASDSLGGYLKYTLNALNQIYWDAASFLATAHNWLGNQVFAGNVTTTGILAVQTPTSTQDAVNKSYADARDFRTAFWGTGRDGNVTISATTTLTGDGHYQNLTVNQGVTLYTAGYQVFATGTVTVNGILGNMGGTATTATVPAAASSSVLGGGGNGGYASSGGGADGGNGTSTLSSLGGAGGRGDGFGGTCSSCAGGTVTASKTSPYSGDSISWLVDFTSTSTAHQVMGGGGGGGGKTNGGNAGGAGGGGGGGVFVSAPTITVGTFGRISANGGNGAQAVSTGSGGGGGGGFVVLRYMNLTISGFVSASGGICTTTGNTPNCQNGSDGTVFMLDMNQN